MIYTNRVSAMTFGHYYVAPESVVISLSDEDIICTSPQPGENEGVGYEEWNV